MNTISRLLDANASQVWNVFFWTKSQYCFPVQRPSNADWRIISGHAIFCGSCLLPDIWCLFDSYTALFFLRSWFAFNASVVSEQRLTKLFTDRLLCMWSTSRYCVKGGSELVTLWENISLLMLGSFTMPVAQPVADSKTLSCEGVLVNFLWSCTYWYIPLHWM